MKTVCIYHSVDLDGWMSAAIVKHWFKTTYKDCSLEEDSNVIYDNIKLQDSITFIGYNYGQPIPDLSEYDKVIMCDISFPKDIMKEITYDAGTNNFIWLDHHKSAIEDVMSRFDVDDCEMKGIRDTKFAACELTWKYFFPNEPMPEIIRLLGRYDCFGHKGTDEEQKVLEFQYGARQCISNYEEAYTKLVIGMNADYVEHEILTNGKAIYKYLCTEAKQVYKNRFEIILSGDTQPNKLGVMFVLKDGSKETHWQKLKFICINRERFNPINFGIDYHKDGYDGCACFYFDGSNYNFSLYNDNGLVDCSIIAKQYGGGGHKGAAGFRCNNETFLNIING